MAPSPSSRKSRSSGKKSKKTEGEAKALSQLGLFESLSPADSEKKSGESSAEATLETATNKTLLIEEQVARLESIISSHSQIKAPEDISIEVEKIPPVFTVTELAMAVKDTLRESFGSFSVRGEICDFKGIHRNGHLYCGLKDENSQIRMVMWRNALGKLPFEIRQGLEVVVSGKLDFYGASGSLQINAERIEPLGIGALQLRFEQLKEKLKAEGLFDLSRKKTIPPVAWRIGIVTGRSTAAFQDMLRIFRSRFPMAEVYLFHASVQGKGAPAEISAAIERANAFSLKKNLDVLIVGRGGGSYEDLFCFNDEALARTIAASRVPTISAVGHEIDFTIADFVADRRAATPTHAAQESVPEAILWIDRLKEIQEVLERKIEDLIADFRIRIDHLMERLIQAAPHKKLEHQREILRGIGQRLRSEILRRLQLQRSLLGRLVATLEALSPLKSFDRGWALATNKAGLLVQSIQDVSPGDKVNIRLKNGYLNTLVESVESLKK